MIDARSATVLQQILRRESRSFLQYVGEAFPWTTANERGALDKLRRLLQEEGRALAVLGQFLLRQRYELPYLGTYPDAFTSMNFVSLDHLLPLLVDRQREGIAELERDLRSLHGSEARGHPERLLELKRRHLSDLEALAAAHPEPAVR
jgi:hypothetical protein